MMQPVPRIPPLDRPASYEDLVRVPDIEVLRLDAARRTILATHAGAEVVRAEPFTEIEMGLGSLWADGATP